MSKLQTKTDNTYFNDKVAQRLRHLPKKKNILILDAFAGHGRIWREIKRRRPDKKIKILKIEKKAKLNGIYLKGDNVKYLENMDLSKFDVIDLDGYGVPYRQLKIVLQKMNQMNCMVFVTFIQVQLNFGSLPKKMLKELGYSDQMQKKCPTLFKINVMQKMIKFLSLYGCRKIWLKSFHKYNYFCFKIKK